MLNEAHCLSDNIASYCRQQSVQPVTVDRISQLTTVQELVALAPVRIKLRLTRIKQLGRALQRKLEARLGEIAGSGFRHEEYKLFVA